MRCPTCPDSTLIMADRVGIEIDYCPTCRGVWLDRGELDKIIERSAAVAPAVAPGRDDRFDDRFDDAPQRRPVRRPPEEEEEEERGLVARRDLRLLTSVAVFRRKKQRRDEQPSPPPREVPRWAARVAEARELVLSTPGGAVAAAQLDAMEQALHAAEADRRRVRDAAARLDPERTLADLKAAMRAHPFGEPTPQIEALQRRNTLINDLLNRDEQLETQISRAVADLEALSAEAVHASAMAPSDADAVLRRHLHQLEIDVAALAAAHDEIGRLADPAS